MKTLIGGTCFAIHHTSIRCSEKVHPLRLSVAQVSVSTIVSTFFKPPSQPFGVSDSQEAPDTDVIICPSSSTKACPPIPCAHFCRRMRRLSWGPCSMRPTFLTGRHSRSICSMKSRRGLPQTGPRTSPPFQDRPVASWNGECRAFEDSVLSGSSVRILSTDLGKRSVQKPRIWIASAVGDTS